MKVLVTGSNGQMGQALQSIADQYPMINFIFTSSKTLDITDVENCYKLFKVVQPDVCINFAAYTNVEKAEDEIDKAFGVNANGSKNIAEVCLQFKVVLVHISTDFVFDGEKSTPYSVLDKPNPINVYGASKLKGEQNIQEILSEYYIIRTSWVYSDFGHNFKNTMLKLAQTRNEISVVNDQIGCPTNAIDICQFILHLLQENKPYGLYHFRGNKICSWYDFAVSIFKENNCNMKVNAITSIEYPVKANRPKYSVLK